MLRLKMLDRIGRSKYGVFFWQTSCANTISAGSRLSTSVKRRVGISQIMVGLVSKPVSNSGHEDSAPDQPLYQVDLGHFLPNYCPMGNPNEEIIGSIPTDTPKIWCPRPSSGRSEPSKEVPP